MTAENADQIIARIKRERGLPINSTKPPDEGTSGKTKAEAAAWRQGTFTAEQLQEMKFPPVSWIVPDIIPAEGVALLCSKPKFGKSWLAYDLCIACTMGRFTLAQSGQRRAMFSTLHLRTANGGYNAV
jgi:AAA domain-containing protein